MTQTQSVLDRIKESGVVAVLRGIDADQIVPVAQAINDAGVEMLEVTANDPLVADKIAAVDAALDDTDAVVGAGTVLSASTAQSVIDAGAKFVFAPNVNAKVITTCNRHDVLSAPGVMTPTEAVTAIESGADVLKVFPASTVGPDHLGALRGPLGDVPVLPTGGIGPDNVEAFFDAGATAVGAGSSIVDYDAIEAGDMEQVQETAEAMVEAVETARS